MTRLRTNPNTADIGVNLITLPTGNPAEARTKITFGAPERMFTTQAKDNPGVYEMPGSFSLEQMAIEIELSDFGSCLDFYAKMVTGYGWFIEKSVPDPDADQERALRSFIDFGFTGGFRDVLRQFDQDYQYFGKGLLELAPPLLEEATISYQGAAGKVTRPQVAGVHYLPRLNVRQRKPRKINTGKLDPTGKPIWEYDGMDILFPILEYRQSAYLSASQNVRFLRSFGDPRRISKYAGQEDSNLKWSDIAPEWLAMTRKKPISPIDGWPKWIVKLPKAQINQKLDDFTDNVIGKNCIPDVMVWIEGATTNEAELSRKIENKFTDTRSKNINEGPGTRVAVMSIPAPKTPSAHQVEVEITLLNPIKESLPALLDLRKDNRVEIAAACGVPPFFVNIEPKSGLGGGGLFEAYLKLFLHQVAEEQLTIADTILDPLVSRGLGISDWRIRLETISLSDPQVEANVAKIWDSMVNLTPDEKRDRIGNLGELGEAMKQEPGKFKVGRIMVMSPQLVAYDLESLEAMAQQFAAYPEGSDAQAQAEQALASVMGDTTGSSEARQVFAGMVRHIALQLRGVVTRKLEAEGEQLVAEGNRFNL